MREVEELSIQELTEVYQASGSAIKVRLFQARRRALQACLGETTIEACNLCTFNCVVGLSAVRAVNEHSTCGRCNICPANFNITSLPIGSLAEPPASFPAHAPAGRFSRKDARHGGLRDGRVTTLGEEAYIGPPRVNFSAV
jgi:hypothetical protein